MRDRLYYFTLGFCIAMMVAWGIVSMLPTPVTEVVCGVCGSEQWWFVLAE
jgi:hypothetical protein